MKNNVLIIFNSKLLLFAEDVIFGFVLWFRSSEIMTMGQTVLLEALYVSKPYRQKYVEQALFEQTV